MQAAAKLTVGHNNQRGGWVDSTSASSSLSSKSTASLFNRLLKTVTGGKKSSTKQNSSGFSLAKRSDISTQHSVEDNWILVSNQIVANSAQRENFSLNISRSESAIATEDQQEQMRSSRVEEEDQAVDESLGLAHLPIELVCKIIGYLELNDRKNASLVCKRWRAAFLAGNFLTDVLVKANNNLFVSMNNRPESAAAAARGDVCLGGVRHRASSTMVMVPLAYSAQFCLNLVNLEFDHESADVSLMLGNLRAIRQNSPIELASEPLLPRLKLIKFNKTAISWRVLVDFLIECPNLETLQLLQCDSLFMSGIPAQGGERQPLGRHLRHLSLARNRYLTDSFFNYFLRHIDSLDSLDLSHCLLTKTNYKSIQNGQLDLKSSHVVLTVENLIRVAGEQPLGSSLRSLALNGVEIFNHDEQSLLALVERLPGLADLQLAALPGLKVTTCVEMLGKLKHLKSIDLNGSSQEVSGKTLEYLFVDAFNRLETIKLTAAKINDPDVLKLNVIKCANLRHLDLSSCFFTRSFGTLSRMNEFIAQFARSVGQLVHLETLVLAYCEFMVNDEFVEVVCSQLGHSMRHLDLHSCNKITDKAVHAIARHLVNLVYLDLSWCQNVSDYGLNSSIEYSRDRQMLNELNKDLNLYIKKYAEQPFLLIKQKMQIANETKKLAQSESSYDLANAAAAESSNEQQPAVEESRKEEETGAIVSLKDLRHLRTLKLESCINITDVGLYRGINLIQLKELDVKLCPEVRGDFVYAKFDRLGSGGDSAADAAANDRGATNNRLFSNLKTLNLSQCVNFNVNALRFVVDNAPFLRELSVSAVQSVDVKFIEHLTRAKKLLSHFDVSFCMNVTEASVDAYEHVLFSGFGSKEFVLDRRFISR